MFYIQKIINPEGVLVDVIRTENNAIVVNPDGYAPYVAWLAEGNTPEPWEA